MEVLWDRGSAAAREVHKAVEYERDLAYTTVSTVLTRLKAEKMVTAKPGVKPYRFSAAVTREEAAERSVDKVVDDWFGGSRTSLVAYMDQAGGRSVSDLREARDLLEEAIKKADEG
jgi:BlaI family penicillinase repressor